MREALTVTLELLGLACLVVAGFLVAMAVGFAVAGVGLVLLGLSMDKPFAEKVNTQ